MRLFLYYAVHSVKNQIKKLFKTWVAVFFAVCLLFGAVIGIGVGMLTGDIEEASSYSDDAYVYEGEEPTREDVLPWIEIAVLALGAVIVVTNLLGGDKSGGQIFTMADVNLLFSAPMKPQSVMLFKLMTQIGATLAASLYLIFQLPNFLLNLNMTGFDAFAVIVAWFFILAYAKLINVFSYTVASTKEKYKKRLRPGVYGVLALIAFCFYLFMKTNGLTVFPAILKFFGSGFAKLVPVIGWLSAFVHFAVTGQVLFAVLTALGLLGGLVLLVYIIWNVDADFYEDSLSLSAEKEDTLRSAGEASKGVVITRKKERKRKISRDGIGKGYGANVLFYKSLHNRFRFAYLRVFTKTSITYLLACTAIGVVLRFFSNIRSFTPVALIMCLLVFYRSLGNPVSTDISNASFFMIPESAHKKLFFSHLAGSTDCVLDLLPGFLVATLLLGTNPIYSLLWLIFVVSIDFYSASVGTFLDLAIPESIATIIKSLIQIIFIYFGLLPIAAFIVAGLMLDLFSLFTVLAAVFSILCGALFFALSPIFLSGGKR